MEKTYLYELYLLDLNNVKVPVPVKIINFKDGNKNNYLLENLELLCYNDYFLLVADPLTPDQVRHIEDNTEVRAVAHDWDMDEAHLDNMRALGLI
jgi:hypothetical protein